MGHNSGNENGGRRHRRSKHRSASAGPSTRKQRSVSTHSRKVTAADSSSAAQMQDGATYVVPMANGAYQMVSTPTTNTSSALQQQQMIYQQQMASYYASQAGYPQAYYPLMPVEGTNYLQVVGQPIMLVPQSQMAVPQIGAESIAGSPVVQGHRAPISVGSPPDAPNVAARSVSIVSRSVRSHSQARSRSRSTTPPKKSKHHGRRHHRGRRGKSAGKKHHSSKLSIPEHQRLRSQQTPQFETDSSAEISPSDYSDRLSMVEEEREVVVDRVAYNERDPSPETLAGPGRYVSRPGTDGGYTAVPTIISVPQGKKAVVMPHHSGGSVVRFTSENEAAYNRALQKRKQVGCCCQ